jgi:hypothetical protein
MTAESYAPKPLGPIMTGAEYALYIAQIRKARKVLEFGLGGSTIGAVMVGVESVNGVESSQEWVDKVAENAKHFLKPQQTLNLHFADIGPTRAAGWPTGSPILWSRYYTDIWNTVDGSTVDVFLIDGRFRVCCALESAKRSRADAKIVIHDFWNRPFYHGILEFVDCVDRVDTMGVFRIKPTLNHVHLEAMIVAHSNNPS